MLLRAATLPDGSVVDVRLQDERIVAVRPRGELSPMGAEEVVELAGYLLIPAPVEPHTHLDKALTAHLIPTGSGGLDGAIEAWCSARAGLDDAGVRERARTAAMQFLANGATTIRTHADVGPDIGLRAVHAMVDIGRELSDVLRVQVVAMASGPMAGPAGAETRALVEEALDAGADVVGGSPHTDDDPSACLEACLALAVGAGVPIDLHLDENLDPSSRDLDRLLDHVAAGFPHPVTASHCSSLGIRPPDEQRRVAEVVAEVGISVVTLPQTNLYLLGRGGTGSDRGLTALRPLLRAGATVAAGADNVQDPFNPVGCPDPIQTAALLVTAGHLSPAEALAAVTSGARSALGLSAVSVTDGAPADLLAVAGGSLEDVLGSRTADRIVVSHGRVVARSRVHREIPRGRRGGSVRGSSEMEPSWR